MLKLETGYEIIDTFLTHEQLVPIYAEIESLELATNSGGIRNAEKKFNAIKELAYSDLMQQRAQNYLDGKPRLVRAILFDKTPENNWLVSWHQDRTVTVSATFEDSHWAPWTIKDGVHHVQPPLEVLDQMVTFRIHLDDTDVHNGCLKVLPNSHKLGILTQSEIQDYLKQHEPELCEAKAGSALVMRPHILHASSKATNPSNRRILHLEYSSYSLPEGITWA